MTTSAIEICNLALSEIPAQPINSLNDNTIASEACRLHFTQAVEQLMEMGDWTFGKVTANLALVSSERPGWQYGYALPNDMAFPISLKPQDSDMVSGTSLPFDFEGDVIWTNHEAVRLEYITRSPDFFRMTAMFKNALACVLASKLVMPIKRDRNAKQALLQEAEIWVGRALARSINANATQNTYGENFIPSALRGYFEAPE